MPKQLIMVMGVQRSGTTVLFESLASDPALTAFNESQDSEVFDKYFLRPECEIRPILRSAPGPVLLKPLQETHLRSVAEVVEEYNDYDVRIVWLYRDPVNVFYSGCMKGWRTLAAVDAYHFAHSWSLRNQRLLSALPSLASRTAIVRYEDLIADRAVFQKLCHFLDLRGQYLFRRDSRAGRRRTPVDLQTQIDVWTAQVFAALERQRSYMPRFYKAPLRQLKRRSLAQRKTSPQERATLPGPEIQPAQLEGLFLWLHAGSLTGYRDGETVHAWPDSGPRDIPTSHNVAGPLYCQNCVNGLPALRFSVARSGPDHYTGQQLTFGSPGDWAFTVDGSEFTLLLVFNPAEPDAPSQARARTMLLLDTGLGAAGRPGFGFGWRAAYQAHVSAIIASPAPASRPIEDVVVLTLSAPQAHPPGTWRVAACTHKRRANGHNMAIDVNAAQAGLGIKRQERDYPDRSQVEGVLVLGGDARAPRPGVLPFNGYLAEVIMYNKALRDRERLGVTAYLRRKYGI